MGDGEFTNEVRHCSAQCIGLFYTGYSLNVVFHCAHDSLNLFNIFNQCPDQYSQHDIN